MPTPQWGQELSNTNGDVRKHKVWVVIGKMKFEIPVSFSSLSQAQERVAGKVVDQFKAQGPVEALKTVGSKARFWAGLEGVVLALPLYIDFWVLRPVMCEQVGQVRVSFWF